MIVLKNERNINAFLASNNIKFSNANIELVKDCIIQFGGDTAFITEMKKNPDLNDIKNIPGFTASDDTQTFLINHKRTILRIIPYIGTQKLNDGGLFVRLASQCDTATVDDVVIGLHDPDINAETAEPRLLEGGRLACQLICLYIGNKFNLFLKQVDRLDELLELISKPIKITKYNVNMSSELMVALTAYLGNANELLGHSEELDNYDEDEDPYDGLNTHIMESGVSDFYDEHADILAEYITDIAQSAGYSDVSKYVKEMILGIQGNQDYIFSAIYGIPESESEKYIHIVNSIRVKILEFCLTSLCRTINKKFVHNSD